MLAAALLLLTATLSIVLLPDTPAPPNDTRHPEVSLSAEDEAIVAQLETFGADSFDLAQNLDIIEDFPVLEELDPNDLESMQRR